jgi:uncharacterized protein YbjT (DUF2867 family)
MGKNVKNSGVESHLVLLTGATGYIGRNLLPWLLRRGLRVRCLARQPAAVKTEVGVNTEVFKGDVMARESLTRAMDGVDTAYYLIHSMGAGSDFEAMDRQAARNFAEAARSAGVGRIIYLGGLAHGESGLSPHLRSRHEVGRCLLDSGVEVIEFRASVIIGSGSLSFELIRALVERLPIMICPRWVRTLAQPIATPDVMEYLTAALDLPFGESRVYEIGGPDRVSYADIMREYARQRRLRRLLVPVPVLTPRLSSLWLALVTPVLSGIGRSLIEGVRNPSIVQDHAASSAFDIRPFGLAEAIRAALLSEEDECAAKPLAELAGASTTGRDHVLSHLGNRILDCRTINVPVSPQQAFAPIRKIGGANGWYYGNWLWGLRGLIDMAFGGPGMKPSRPRQAVVEIGDRIDCWKVDQYEAGHRLRLEAMMKLPGRAWLEFEVAGSPESSTIRQTAVFDPQGLAGLLYWHALWPVHNKMFGGMLDAIGRAAIRLKTVP